MAKMRADLGISSTRDDELCNDLAELMQGCETPSEVLVSICERSDVTAIERGYLAYLLGGYMGMHMGRS